MISKVIPVYAKNFKKEYLFVLRVNDKIKYFIDNIKEATCGLFNFIRIINYRRRYYQNFVNPFPGFENIYYDFELFCSKFKINYEDYEYLKCNDDFDFDC